MNALSTIYETIQHTFQRTEPDVWTSQIAGQSLHVREIQVPSAGAPHQKPPLLIGLHGYGIDERQMKTLVNVPLDQPFIYLHVHLTHTQQATMPGFPLM